MPKRATALPESIMDILRKGVDCIFHAGDWTQRFVYDELSKFAPVYGVRGNVESDRWSEEMPEKVIVQLEEIKIAVVHGHIGKGKSTPERAYRSCREDKPDAVIFGHSHIPYHEVKEGIILFNPGSPTDKRRQKQYSFGVATIDRSEIQFEHQYFS
jgi:putative phosphoesterase